jgi:DNA invertase Pin-like site-specific DNA recombinase
MSGAGVARRAVAYIRLAEGGEGPVRGDATAPQRAAIEAWARRESVEIRSWHVDLGIGGDTPIAERPGLVSAYRAVREEAAGVLVAAKADRFAHDQLVCWLIERAALTQGATIRTADGASGLTTADSEAPLREQENKSWTRSTIDLARAYDRVTLRARIRASLAEKRARGERVGTVPFGYRLSSDGVHVEPDEREQAVVDTVRRLTHEGLSQRAIVAHLAACGVTGRTGAPLRQTQIANILRSAS